MERQNKKLRDKVKELMAIVPKQEERRESLSSMASETSDAKQTDVEMTEVQHEEDEKPEEKGVAEERNEEAACTSEDPAVPSTPPIAAPTTPEETKTEPLPFIGQSPDSPKMPKKEGTQVVEKIET